MKLHKPLVSALMLCVLGAPFAASAADGDWKRGRVYYRMVCTACHGPPTFRPTNITRARIRSSFT
jgi:cytochrome c5